MTLAYQYAAYGGSIALSVIVPLFSGIVGGVLVMLIQNHLRNKREQRNREEELRGLIRIVDFEMAQNENLLQEALTVDTVTAAGAQYNPILELRNLETRDWDNAKVRLARLALGEHFHSLNTYYRVTQDLSAEAQRIYNQSIFHMGPMAGAQEHAEECRAASDAAREQSQRVLETPS
jgi:hypothetical protein